MTTIAGLKLPQVGIERKDITSPKNLALGGIAATSIVAGGVIGKLRGNPLAGLGIGAAVAAAALGAAFLGNASASQRDGWCDYRGDIDCDYPGTDPYYPPSHDPYYPPSYDPYPNTDPYPYPGNDYPYPGSATGRGDD